MQRVRRTLLAVLCLASSAPAASAVTNEAKEEGVVLRLVAERPGEDGRFRAALLIDLEPGWKTYWLDPGEAGIPPVVDFAGSSGVDRMATHFPLPHRFDDGFSKSIVYSEPLAVALEGHAAGADATLHLKLTLGLCREVCIPASAELQTELGSPEAQSGAVAAAFTALPKPSTGGEGIVAAELSADETSLRVTVRPGRAAENADLFAAAPGGWFFGPPSSIAQEGESATVTLPVTAKPRRDRTLPTIDAILAGPAGAWRADALATTSGKG